jgi:hypothetical protein
MTNEVYPRRVLIGFVFMMSVLVWNRPVFAEDRDTPRVLTVEEAVETALRHNPQLKAREQERDTARGALLQAQAYANPALDLAVETDRVFAGQGEGRSSVGITQTIVTGGKRRQRRDNARLGIGLAEQVIEDAKRRLVAGGGGDPRHVSAGERVQRHALREARPVILRDRPLGRDRRV